MSVARSGTGNSRDDAPGEASLAAALDSLPNHRRPLAHYHHVVDFPIGDKALASLIESMAVERHARPALCSWSVGYGLLSRWKNSTALPASIAYFSSSGTSANISSITRRDSGQSPC